MQEHLEAMERDTEFKEAVIDRYLDDQIGFEALNALVGCQDAESIHASKTLLDQGDELAEEVAEL